MEDYRMKIKMLENCLNKEITDNNEEVTTTSLKNTVFKKIFSVDPEAIKIVTMTVLFGIAAGGAISIAQNLLDSQSAMRKENLGLKTTLNQIEKDWINQKSEIANLKDEAILNQQIIDLDTTNKQKFDTCLSTTQVIASTKNTKKYTCLNQIKE